MRQTTIIKKQDIKQNWFLIDAENQVLGRLATFIAYRLRGKDNVNFFNNINFQTKMIVVNVDKVILTGNKEQDKQYYSHSGYPGGLKTRNAKTVRKEKPTKLLESAVKGMLPHTKLGREQFKNLYLYAGPNHQQIAQKPTKIEASQCKI